MQLTAETLSRYQNYQLCVDAYVEEALRQIDVDESIFEQITSLIDGKSSQISKVFNSPEQVLGKLIQSCYDNRLGEFIHHKLDPLKRKNLELYLSECQKLYEKTSALSAALSKHRPGSGKGTQFRGGIYGIIYVYDITLHFQLLFYYQEIFFDTLE